MWTKLLAAIGGGAVIASALVVAATADPGQAVAGSGNGAVNTRNVYRRDGHGGHGGDDVGDEFGITHREGDPARVGMLRLWVVPVSTWAERYGARIWLLRGAALICENTGARSRD
jgi:hypothetical protein